MNQTNKLTVSQKLNMGLSLQNLGDYERAKKIYEEVLVCQPNNFEALQLIGVISLQLGQYSVAIDFFKKSLTINNIQPFVLNNLGLAFLNIGNLEEAINFFTKALEIQPFDADFHFNLGIAQATKSDYQFAFDSFSNAIKLRPNFISAYVNRANVLRLLKKYELALKDCDEALGYDSKTIGAHNVKGQTLNDMKKYEQALRSYDSAIKNGCHDAEVFFNRAIVLTHLKYVDEAIASYKNALVQNKNFFQAYNNLGLLLNNSREYDGALSCFTQAIKLNNIYSEAYNNLGIVLIQINRLDDAILNFKKAIELNSKYAEPYVNMAKAFKEKNELIFAKNCYESALGLNPNLVEANTGLGILLTELGQLDEAIDYQDKAIKLNFNYSVAFFNKSLTLLKKGDFINGWKLFEYRWKLDNIKMKKRDFVQPLWLGVESIEGMSILLHCEAGLGDTIQFCRYALLAKERGAIITLEVQKPLVNLLRDCFKEKGIQVINEDESELLRDYKYHCPLMSLPLAFHTTIRSIPYESSYIFADSRKITYWGGKLGVKEKIRIGLVWSGGFRQDQPELWSINERRNIKFSLIASSLGDLPFDFYSLQKGELAESECRLHKEEYWTGGNFYNFSDELIDFSDTAALIMNLDLVISVDTSTAHLAAALGKPTWILNRFDNCWRWMQGKTDSPWYQTVKLFNQASDFLWQPVLSSVKRDLKVLAKNKSKTSEVLNEN